MLARSWTTCVVDGKIHEVEVQALFRRGLFKFDLVGLAKPSAREGRDRILAALHSLGVELPKQKILVHLSPSNLPKDGAHFDLPILAALLKALGQIPSEKKSFYWGEVQLDGQIKETPFLLNQLLWAKSQKAEEMCAGPLSEQIPELFTQVLGQEWKSLTHIKELYVAPAIKKQTLEEPTDIWKMRVLQPWLGKRVKGWDELRASEDQRMLWALVLTGRHHLYMKGGPGIGKTFWAQLARKMQSPLSLEHFLERASLSLGTRSAWKNSPFESPHHSSSRSSIVGGGSGRIHIGSISRAHRGILFMDEFPEFQKDVIESLREPLQDKCIRIHRGEHHLKLPADIQLIAAANACPCGNFETKRYCDCSPVQIEKYRARISRAILDRIHFKVNWSFEQGQAGSKWSSPTFKSRLLEAQNFKIGSIDSSVKLPPMENPRRSKRWLEGFCSWIKWHQILSPSQKHVEQYSQFCERVEGTSNEKDYGLKLAQTH